jgi:hypothetical protein
MKSKERSVNKAQNFHRLEEVFCFSSIGKNKTIAADALATWLVARGCATPRQGR